MKRCVLLLAVTLLATTTLRAQQDGQTQQLPPGVTADTIEKLAEKSRESIVVIRFTGREGRQQGLGTGFVISPDGLIATNMHVLGEARPITVELADGRQFDVTSIHASDKAQDLAVVKIDADGLKPLELGDSDSLNQGAAVMAIGNPLGLVRSVVTGILSAKRDHEPKLQLSMPIIQGNSGGPVLDLQGKVHGIVSQRSATEANLGYAVTINSLKPLLAKPNTIPMSQWLTIGALDSSEWQPLFGARWRQRAGRIQVQGMGTGFGGRSVCLWQQPVPKVPFELAVDVQLEDEAGAAGLVFHSDGDQRHYGFYPSGGSLRLSRFDGPDVFSWKVLNEVTSSAYQPGEWNTLKVRIEPDRLLCYVNEQLVIESEDSQFKSGQVGLAKFRDTHAQFKNFRVGTDLPSLRPSEKELAEIREQIDGPLKEVPEADLVEQLASKPAAAQLVLQQEAKQLIERAEKLQKLATAVHQQNVRAQLVAVLNPQDAQQEQGIDLLRAALLLAKLDNPELDVDAYLEDVEKMTQQIEKSLPKDATPANRLQALNDYLFKQLGYHGSRTNYYSRANSYLNEVIDDREGLPITLSVLYMELGRRLGIRIVGVPLPGHFVVRFEPEEGESELIDVFAGGAKLTETEAAAIIISSGQSPEVRHFEATTPHTIVKRMLYNLLHVADREADRESMLSYLDTYLAIEPEAGVERWMRAELRLRLRQIDGARDDADWLLEHAPDGVDMNRVHQLRQLLDQ